MRRALSRLALAALALALAGCPTRVVHRPVDPPARLPPPHKEPELVGRTHVVKAGETLWRISRMYEISVAELSLANGITDVTQLEVGRSLVIPGPPAAAPPPASTTQATERKTTEGTTSTAALDWPMSGVLYAKFGVRGEARHDGIDISAPEGTLIRAADDGLVIYSGVQRGYGNIVILQHSTSLITLYAQNKENLVREGVRVKRGDPIARVGTFNRTSGPHLHFEVREGSAPKDPLKYLPPPR